MSLILNMDRDDSTDVRPRKTLFQWLVIAVCSLYFLNCAASPEQWRFLDGVNLMIHEAGHVLFRPFGEFVMMCGGSLIQLMMPAAFVIHFYWYGQRYYAALVLFWLGQSMLNVSVYAADAQAMALPLLGGEAVTHDWNYILSELGLLSSTPLVGRLIHLTGTFIILLAILGAIKLSNAATDKMY